MKVAGDLKLTTAKFYNTLMPFVYMLSVRVKDVLYSINNLKAVLLKHNILGLRFSGILYGACG
jgi:hypothetical protein